MTTTNPPRCKSGQHLSGECAHLCPGGNRCLCNARYEHVYHICKSEACQCHEQYPNGASPTTRKEVAA